MRLLVRWGITAAVALVIILAAVAAARILGLSCYRITTGSMEPVLPVGTIVVDSRVLPLAPYRPITFTADGGIVTHVLVGYAKDGSLVTRGLANRANDVWTRPVHERDVKGRVVFAILLLAPAFWASSRGVAALAGIALLVTALGAARSNRFRRTESFA